MEYESDNYNNCNCCFLCSHQRINKRTGGHRNERTNGDHPNYSFIEIGRNTEKSPGDLRRRCHSISSERTSANADVKNSQRVNNDNRTFENNERKFYKQLNGECTRINQQPDAKETKQIWSKILEKKILNRKLSQVISGSPEIFFLVFPFHLHLFDSVSFQYPQVFVGFLFLERPNFVLIW